MCDALGYSLLCNCILNLRRWQLRQDRIWKRIHGVSKSLQDIWTILWARVQDQRLLVRAILSQIINWLWHLSSQTWNSSSGLSALTYIIRKCHWALLNSTHSESCFEFKEVMVARLMALIGQSQLQVISLSQIVLELRALFQSTKSWRRSRRF